ncbi:hypothetical protein [Winogradskyella sp.]|uniref:energy transducer TonB n=1 Tax=Winogradskyella sp. TaxID=1883156 RepID=UPI00262D96D0|nr:hypothetical protein [Winogradskyella sp.]
MEETIDLINAYLNKELNESEILAFEERLQTDLEFNTSYKEHVLILKGMERVELLKEIDKARKTFITSKWLKYIAIAILVILISILAHNLISNLQNEETKNTSGQDSIENTIDSTIIQAATDSIRKYVVIEIITEQIEIKELTKAFGGIEVIKDTLIKKEIGHFTEEDFKSTFPEWVTYKIENDTIFINSELKQNQKNAKLLKKVNSRKTNTKGLQGVFDIIKSEPQQVEFNAEENYEFTGTEGTIIKVPANAFMDAQTQKQVKGKVSLEVTEYYELSDMLMANLSTKSDDKLLETGGMLKIEARKGNSKLELIPGKEVQVIFDNCEKERMQLFNGEELEGIINWKLNELKEETETKKLESEVQEFGFVDEYYSDIEDYYATNFRFLDDAPTHPNCEKDTNNDEKRKCLKDEISKFISRKFNTSIGERLNLTGAIYIYTTFEIDKKGDVGKIEVRAPHKRIANEVVRVLEMLPRLEPGRQNGNPVVVKYSLPITYYFEGTQNTKRGSRNSAVTSESDSTVAIGVSDSIVVLRSDKKFQKDLEAKPISEISNTELERYTFATTNLGWINCDRFVRSAERKIRYEVKIKDVEGANVKMIFKSISSILPGKSINGQVDFGEVPLNEDVILLVIKKKGDKIYLGKKEVKTKTVSELDLEFKEVTIDELKTELINLNQGFDCRSIGSI